MVAFHFAQGIAQVYFMPSWYDAQPEAAGSFSPIRGLSTRMEQSRQGQQMCMYSVMWMVDLGAAHVRKGYARARTWPDCW